VVSHGRVARADAVEEELPALAELTDRLAAQPLAAPEADEIAVLGRATLAAGVRRGQLLHLGGAIYVAPTAPEHALQTLAALPSPFSVSDARQALGVSRRVAVPLLEHLDAARRTRKLPDGTRLVVPRQG
jgi:selenocysteine-specific elongation factor